MIGIYHVGVGTDINVRRKDYVWIYQQLISGLLEIA